MMNIKKNAHYYFLIIIVLLFPLSIYPNFHGSDYTQIIWMANAIKNGNVFFSNKTWLIHPLSYFGIYPFSFYGICSPIILSILWIFFDFISFGYMGLPESILFYDFLLIVLLYKISRSFSKNIFDDKKKEFIFTSFLMFSINSLYDFSMTTTTRYIITIIMLKLMDLNIQLLTNEKKRKRKIIYILILLIIGSLTHRIWFGLLGTIFVAIYLYFIRNNIRLRYITIISIIPLSLIAFLIGFNIFFIDPDKIWSPFFSNSTIFGAIFNLAIHYTLQTSIFVIFLPIGFIILLCNDILKNKKLLENKNVLSNNKLNYVNYYFFINFIMFSFLSSSFYAKVLFLPVLVFFSAKGLFLFWIFIKKHSKKKIYKYIVPFLLLIFTIIYATMYNFLISPIEAWIFSILFLAIFISLLIIILNHQKRFNCKHKILQKTEIPLILIAIIMFSTITVTERWETAYCNDKLWLNRTMSKPEIEIIEYLKNESLEGYIYTNVPRIAARMCAVTLYPIFNDKHKGGQALYYNLITPYEVQQNLEFNPFGIYNLNFLSYNQFDPWRKMRSDIINYNGSSKIYQLYYLKEILNIQYIISTYNRTLLEDYPNTFTNSSFMIQLYENFEPDYIIEPLCVWKFY